MKKLLSIITILCFLSSCSVVDYLIGPKETIIDTYFYDFRKHAKEGFFISPDPYIGDFDPVGIIKINIFPGKIEVQGEPNGKVVYGQPKGEPYTYYVTEEFEPSELLDIIVEKAKEQDADAIVNFEAYSRYKTIEVADHWYNVFDHYELSGFAIKRK